MITLNVGRCFLVNSPDMRHIEIKSIKKSKNMLEVDRVMFSGALLQMTRFNLDDFFTIENRVFIPGYIIECKKEEDVQDCMVNIMKSIEGEISYVREKNRV